MRTEVMSVVYEGLSYPVEVTFKRVRNISFRLSRDGGSMKVSCPCLTERRYLERKIAEYFPKLKRKLEFEPSESGDEVYLFGVKNTIGGYGVLDEKKKAGFLKGKLLSYIKEREPFYEKAMGIERPYELKVRSMRSRYGVNSRSNHRLTFALELVHYDPKIIDSVIVHELAHDFERNHQKAFYEIVFRFCPDYKRLYTNLRKHDYGNG
ncbi:MAG: M48 family metallopeptidase [Bacilli bacterium]|jgi:predicted metal-dependent hydrolase|nr:M48 family metallopeptidase [Bacilli bacterium]